MMPHTGAAYVFVNIAGSLHGYCLLTGTEILRTAQSNRQIQGKCFLLPNPFMHVVPKNPILVVSL